MISFFFFCNFLYILLGLWWGSRLSLLLGVSLLSMSLFMSLAFFWANFISWLWLMVYVGGMLIIFVYCMFITQGSEAEENLYFQYTVKGSSSLPLLGLCLSLPLWGGIPNTTKFSVGDSYGSFFFRGVETSGSPQSSGFTLCMLTEASPLIIYLLFFIIVFSLIFILFILSKKAAIEAPLFKI